MHTGESPRGRIADKHEAYRAAAAEVAALVDGEPDLVANLANAVAVLRDRLGFFWVGTYRLDASELVLGPFQGTPACTRIAVGRGVCGAAISRDASIVVPDVEAFPGHIACDSRSRSEVVVVLRDRAGRARGVLDVDSDELASFDDVDRAGLESVAAALISAWPDPA
ncbi:MAG: GAF domain-containing protein [bacterium]